MSTATTARSLAAARDQVRAALDVMAAALAGEAFAWASDGEIADTLLDFVGFQRRLDAMSGEVSARVSGGTAFAEAGFRTAAAWLRARTNESFAGARRLLDAGDWIIAVPQMAHAWRRGLVGRGHVAALIEAHQRYPRLSAELTLIESQLAEVAADLDPRTFQRTLMAKLYEIDPDAVDDAESKRRRRDIGLHVSTLLDGFVKVDGVLSPELGQHLINSLASARDAIRARDDQTDAPQPERRLSQINADALQYILDAATSATGEGKLPDIGGSRPVVQIVIDSESLIAEGAAAPGWITSLTGTAVTPVSAASARRLACDSVRQVLLLDPRGHLDAISRFERTVPAPMRRAITLRERGSCRFPGCSSAIREVHHIVFWEHGGSTTTDNLVGLCSHHHHLIHDKGWSLSGDPNHRLIFTDPRHRQWHSDPPDRD